MTGKLILASAGAGKSQEIVKEALELSDTDERVLLLTYTRNNQRELLNKFLSIRGYKPENVVIKGWFKFLLEDMIRPYQSCVLQERIEGIVFNERNPHYRDGYTVPGRGEKIDGSYNALCFMTESQHLAHTHFISKLASIIQRESGKRSTQRLADIYSAIFIDEVQDLVGWDYTILSSITRQPNLSLICVGDFRQTIYRTSTSTKKPVTSTDKVEALKDMGLVVEYKFISRRCSQAICDLADSIHGDDDYCKTMSLITIPDDTHNGLFFVSSSDIDSYIERFQPLLLRHSRNSMRDMCNSRTASNFGEVKGLGSQHVLILPTSPQKRFLLGDNRAFTSDEPKNKFYVAVTRARYSVAFLYDGTNTADGIERWHP